jgi:hypothetical protein
VAAEGATAEETDAAADMDKEDTKCGLLSEGFPALFF